MPHYHFCRSYDREGSDGEDDDDDEAAQRRRAHKVVPSWARGAELLHHIREQHRVDPDRIFATKTFTCELDAVFLGAGGTNRNATCT